MPPRSRSRLQQAASVGVEKPVMGFQRDVDEEAGKEALLDQKHEYYNTSSAHGVDSESWKQVGLMLVASCNCAYILSFSNLMLVPLGWGWGAVSLIAMGGFSFYANWLLAGFHMIDGCRFIRYRDLMGFLFGRKMYYFTWVLQFLTLILSNMGFILLGARALKDINEEFSSTPLRLQVFVVATGALYFLFAYFVPTITAMRNWLAATIVLTSAYVIVLLAILIKDGTENKSKDYKIKGSEVDKVFNAFGAIAAALACNTSGMLPEIQSTLRKPVVSMRKALSLQFTAGLAIYYSVTIAGYWAYGSAVSEYLPKDLSGPKWGRIFVNAAAFLQDIISQHLFVAPVHEALDTKFLRLDESMSSRDNLIRLFFLRALLFGFNTMVTAALPFMGDFVNLIGSFTLFSLTFVFPSMIFLKVKGKTATRASKVWHWTMIAVFSLLSILTTVAAVWLIVKNAKTYYFFANT